MIERFCPCFLANYEFPSAMMSSAHSNRIDKHYILRELVGSVAIAVQRGNVMSYLEGYDRTLYLMSRRSLAEMGDGGESDGEE